MDINHLSNLAKLELNEQEKDKFNKDLSAVLDYFKMLDEVEIEEIEPIAQVSGLENVMRGDEIKKCDENTRKKIINLFPEKKGDFVKVKKILE